jgi:NRPS condensation-like uncharacterized protein
MTSLSASDEAFVNWHLAGVPLNFELEVALRDRFEVARLEQALRSALRQHPRARAALAPPSPFDVSYHWRFDEPQGNALRCRPCVDEAELSRVRDELHSAAFPLEQPPAFRMVLAQTPERDALMFSFSHAAMDAIGGLRVVASVLRHYSGQPTQAAADLPVEPEPAQAPQALGWARAAQHFAQDWARDMREPPTRLARVGARDVDGCGIAHARFSLASDELPLLGRDRVTVNDLLLVALGDAVRTLNERNGAMTGRVPVLMPLNLRRSPHRFAGVGNHSTAGVVSLSTQGDFAARLRDVSRQTNELKRDPQSLSYAGLSIPLPVPMLWKRGAFALAAGGQLDSSTPSAVLSNLGRTAASSIFGELPITELWFSPPCRMPMGVGLGVVTLADTLLFSLRYLRRQLSAAAAQEFLAELVAALASGWQQLRVAARS